MSFQPPRSAPLSRSLLLLGTGLSCAMARAGELSAPPVPLLKPPFAPLLEPDAPELLPPDMPTALSARSSRPTLRGRALPILEPPNTFYQTPAQIEPWLLDVAKSRPEQVKSRILTSTVGGRRVVALEIIPAGVSPWKLRRLVVICRQHGNEPEASASGTRFIREFLTSTDPKKQRLARKIALFIVPIANPDGAAVYQRRTFKNVDMNRDWGHYKSGEVAALEKWIAAWKPHMVVDVHQWLPFEKMPPPMAEASGGPLAKRTAQLMAQNNAAHGYWLAARSRWGLDSLCHRFWGQRFHTPAILLESRHRPDVPGARDVAIGTSLTALWSAAETVTK